ncbi:type VI secretion system tube protein Hcp [Roseateles amylovorans]|uniref:Type VI secretion system tube protein Hcp n=1 Tax=Roseateles amylovorans TaxID=2978473 RepID=A0ABY6B029_9BURK|nr:type VI secretion system tube protein Hcp [Roseateles amylovorans]UXH78518.1 type VI secretion system tube protein Hcp [Roseateles amylovorans]
MASSLVQLQLSIDGRPVVGESQLAGHEGHIEIRAVEWSVATASLDQADAPTGSANFGALRLRKSFDRSSLPLSAALARGARVDRARLWVLDGHSGAGPGAFAAGASPQDRSAAGGSGDDDFWRAVLLIDMSGARLTRLSTDTDGNQGWVHLSEHWELSGFARVELQYFPLSESGQPLPATSVTLHARTGS